MSSCVLMGRTADFRFAGNPIGDPSVYLPGNYFGFRVGPEHRSEVVVGGVAQDDPTLDLVLHAPASLRRTHASALGKLTDEEIVELVDKRVVIEHDGEKLVLRNRSLRGRTVYHGAIATKGKSSGKIRGKRLGPGRSAALVPGDFVGLLAVSGALLCYLVVHDPAMDTPTEEQDVADDTITLPLNSLPAWTDAPAPGEGSGVGTLDRTFSSALDASTWLVQQAPDGVGIALRRRPTRRRRKRAEPALACASTR